MKVECRRWILLLFVMLLAGAQQKRQIDEWQTVDEFLVQPSVRSDRPQNGFVPDERTAVVIGEAVAAALYGKERTASERPFRARLNGSVGLS
jgi:hypothetical protein